MPETGIVKGLASPERDAMNRFSFWFGKVINCGIPVPKTEIIPVSRDLQAHFYMESPEEDMDAVRRFVKDAVEPAMRAAGIGLPFIKNGCYSHKFDASRACMPFPSDLPHAVMTVMYEAMLRCSFQYDGTDELVVRDRIMSDPARTPRIYNGLPFLPEYRVFYDFDRKERLYTVDYWKESYVRPNLRELTDQIVYNAWHPHINCQFEKNASRVGQLVQEAMKGVQGLAGPWSIDVMQDERGGFWLIDMATAESSAYWDIRPDFVKEAYQ